MAIDPFTTGQRRFDGGLNLVVADVDVAENELLVARNCRLVGNAIEKAPGFRKYATEQLDGKIKFIWGDQLNTSSYAMIVAAGSVIYSAAAGVYTSIKTGLNSAADIDMDRYLGRLFMGNGVDANMKYNATTVSNHGLVAPGNFTLTEVNPGAGAFANGQVRQFYITYWDDTNKVESNPNATAQSITIAAGPSNIRLNALPTTTDTNVTDYRIYMTENNGATWYRKDEIDYATYAGLTYTLTTATEGTVELEFDNDPPPIYGLVEYFLNRLYIVDAASKAFIRFSKSFRPEQFPPPFRLGLGDAKDEEVVALVKFYDYLIIGTKTGIWVLDRDPVNEGGVPRQLTGYVGMASNKAHAILDNKFVFLGTDKRIYALSPTDFSKVDVRPDYVSYKIEPLLKDLTSSILSSAVGIFQHVGDRFEASFAVSQSATSYNDTVLVYDPAHAAWTQDDKRVSAFGLVRDSSNAITLYHGDENGYLYYEDATYSGYGASVNSTATAATSTTLTDTTQADIMSTATAGGAATLTDATQAMTVDQYEGEQIYISGGTGAGQYRTIDANTATQFTVSLAWTTPPDNTSTYIVGGFLEKSLNGLDVIITDGAGEGQSRIISSHTPVTVTITVAWNTNPDTTSDYTIGGIDFDVRTGWDAQSQIGEYTKRGNYLHISAIQEGSYNLDYAYARDLIYGATVDYTLSLFNGGYLWGSALWGTAFWGVMNSFTTTLGFEDGSDYYQRMQHRFRNKQAGQPVQVNYIAVTGQDKGIFL